MPAEVLLVLFLILTVVTLIGHGIWLLLAGLFRRLAGKPAARQAAANQPARPIDDLWGFSRTVRRLRQWGWIDQAEEDRLHALGGRCQQRLQGTAAPAAAATAASAATSPAMADRPSTAGAAADRSRAAVVGGPAAPRASEVIAPRHPLDPDPVRSAPARPTGPAQPIGPAQPAVPRPVWMPASGHREASEVLRSFLAAHNIRWGELVAGLLIVICSIGLVISLWNTLATTHRLLPALVFLAGTAAIEAAGLYTLRRWRLRHTSRAVLLIATLLVPLSVVAGIGVAGTGADAVQLSDPLTAAFLLFGGLVYGGAIWVSGQALVRRHDAPWWTLAIAVPTALLPLVPAAVRGLGVHAGWLGLLGSIAMAAAIGMVSSRGVWKSPPHRSADTAIRNRCLTILVGGYALAVLAGFLALRGGLALASTVPLAIAVIPALVALLGAGLAMRRDSRGASWGVVGGTLAAVAALGIAAVWPASLARPQWLVGWAVAVSGTSLAMAVGLNLRWLVTVAAAAGGLAAVMTASLWWGQVPWETGLLLWRRLVASEAMVVACALGVALVSIGLPARGAGPRLGRFGLPLAAAGAGWLTLAALQALLLGCFSSLGWIAGSLGADQLVVGGWTAWQLAAAVLLTVGVTSIAAARQTPRPLWLGPALLATGQSLIFVALIVTAGRSRPALLLDWHSWVAGRAAWWWIGLAAGYALLWQGTARLAAARGPLGLLLRRTRWRVDFVAGGAAGVGTILCAAVVLLQTLYAYHQAQPSAVVVAVLVPLGAMALTAAGLWVAYSHLTDKSQPDAGQTRWLTDIGILAAQAILLWWLARLSPTSVTGMAVIGSGALAGGLLAAALAWWGYRRTPRDAGTPPADRRWLARLARLTRLSGGWSGLVLVTVSAVLLMAGGFDVLWAGGAAAADTGLWVPGSTGAAALLVIAVWMAVVAAALSIASVVASRSTLGLWAAALVPASAVLIAAAAGADRWQWAAAAGWGALLAVAGQRLWQRSGGQSRLRALAVTAPDATAVGPPERWPDAVIGLAQGACALASLLAGAATISLWFDASIAVDIVDLSTLALIVVTAAMTIGWGDRFLSGIRLGVLPATAAAAAAAIALAARWQWINTGDGWRVLLWTWLAVSVLAALHCVAGSVAGRRWWWLSGGRGRGSDQGRAAGRDARWDWGFALALGGLVIGLGYLPRVFDDPAAWASIAACAGWGAMALAAAWHSRMPSSAPRRWAAAQLVAGAAALAAVPLLIGRIGAVAGPPWVAATVAVWLFAWAVAWRLLLPGRKTARMPLVDSTLVWIGIVPLFYLLGISTLEGGWISTSVSASAVGCLAAAAVNLTTPLRVERRGQTVAAYGALLCVVVGLSWIGQQRIGTRDIDGSVAMISVAVTATLLGWIWPLRRALRRTMQRAGFRWSDDGDLQSEAEFAFCLLATTAVIVAGALGAVVADQELTSRYLAIAAVGLCGWALSGVASRQKTDALRTVTVLVFSVALALAALAGPAADRELTAAMRLLVVGVLLVPTNLWLAARVLNLPLQHWRRPLRIGAVTGAGLAGVSLVFMLIAEATIRSDQGIPSLPPASVIGVAVVLAMLSLLCMVPAVLPQAGRVKRVLPDLTDPQRKGLIYAAQALAAITWLHVFLCRPDWGLIGLRPYWPLLVMGLAFLSAAVTEWARRRDDRVLGDVLRQSALYLPLIPVIGFWLSGGRIDWTFAGGRLPYAVLLAAGAVFYGGLSMLWRRDQVPRVIGVVLGNAALWVGLAQTPGWQFALHPQLWLIPPAVCVLFAVHWERRRLDPTVAVAIRYAATLVIYVSSTADMLLQQIGTTLAGPIVLVTLALAGVAAGVVLRVRAFLYLGTTFVLVGVLSMVWHAQQAIGQVWPWWVFGISSGVLLLAGLMAVEKNKAKIQQLSDRLAAWEG